MLFGLNIILKKNFLENSKIDQNILLTVRLIKNIFKIIKKSIFNQIA
mgnify:CR=1 FL=1